MLTLQVVVPYLLDLLISGLLLLSPQLVQSLRRQLVMILLSLFQHLLQQLQSRLLQSVNKKTVINCFKITNSQMLFFSVLQVSTNMVLPIIIPPHPHPWLSGHIQNDTLMGGEAIIGKDPENLQ